MYLANNAIEKGYKTFYIKIDELLLVFKNKDSLSKAKVVCNKINATDVLVIDEMMYLSLTSNDLELFYKIIMSLNETASIVFISNQEVSQWIKLSEDKYAMQLLISRAIANAEILNM